MNQKKIRLYHGGDLNNICNIRLYGLNENRPFYCTRSYGLASTASSDHFCGSVLEVEIFEMHFDYCIERRWFVERPYTGVIQYEGGNEVKVQPGCGIKVFNLLLPLMPRFCPDFDGIDKLISEFDGNPDNQQNI